MKDEVSVSFRRDTSYITLNLYEAQILYCRKPMLVIEGRLSYDTRGMVIVIQDTIIATGVDDNGNAEDGIIYDMCDGIRFTGLSELTKEWEGRGFKIEKSKPIGGEQTN